MGQFRAAASAGTRVSGRAALKGEVVDRVGSVDNGSGGRRGEDDVGGAVGGRRAAAYPIRRVGPVRSRWLRSIGSSSHPPSCQTFGRAIPSGWQPCPIYAPAFQARPAIHSPVA